MGEWVPITGGLDTRWVIYYSRRLPDGSRLAVGREDWNRDWSTASRCRWIWTYYIGRRVITTASDSWVRPEGAKRAADRYLKEHYAWGDTCDTCGVLARECGHRRPERRERP